MSHNNPADSSENTPELGSAPSTWENAIRDKPHAEPHRPRLPRGRHAPPLEVRVAVQRQRLLSAAAVSYARVGYARTTSEAISREAGMSKATFYEHFADRDECLRTLAAELLTHAAKAA